MIKIIKNFFKISMPLLVLAFAKTSLAALVPCGPGTAYPMCDNICFVLALISNIAFFLVGDVMPPLAGLLFLIGGIMMIAAGGSEERYKKGKQIVINTAIGAVIVLASWLIVNSLITTIGRASNIPGFSVTSWWQPPGCQ